MFNSSEIIKDLCFVVAVFFLFTERRLLLWDKELLSGLKGVAFQVVFRPDVLHGHAMFFRNQGKRLAFLDKIEIVNRSNYRIIGFDFIFDFGLPACF